MDSVKVPVPPADRVTFAGLKDRLRPVAELEADRATVPEKLFRLIRMMVELEEEPANMLRLVGLVDMLKSDWLTLTMLEADEVCTAESWTVKRTR